MKATPRASCPKCKSTWFEIVRAYELKPSFTGVGMDPALLNGTPAVFARCMKCQRVMKLAVNPPTVAWGGQFAMRDYEEYERAAEEILDDPTRRIYIP